MMLQAKIACEAILVNLELNSHKKQSENVMKIDVLKCSLVVDAEALFQVV